MSDAFQRIVDLREAAEAASLSEDDLAGTWLGQFERWLEDALAAGVPEPNAMVLATVDPGVASADAGDPAPPTPAPGARTVLLRGVDEHGLRFFTNRASRKGAELAAVPRAALVFPWYQLGRQVIVDGAVEELPEDESDAYFATRPLGSRISSSVSPQSRPIESREWLERHVEEAERALGEDGELERPEHWGGYLVRPVAVEFWQGRRDRLHDRLRYRRAGGEWVVERLAP